MTGFAEGPEANVTEPSEGIILNGYPDSSIPPAAEWNWILREAGKSASPYASVADGIDACDLHGGFNVAPAAQEPDQAIGNWSAAEGRLLCDGRRLWLVSEGGVKCWRTDGAHLWDLDAGSLGGTHADILHAAYAAGILWVVTNDAGGESVVIGVDAEDGTVAIEFARQVDDEYPQVVSAWGVVADGYGHGYVAARDGDGNVRCYSYLVTDGVISGSFEWLYYHGASIHWVAVDCSRVFFIGAAGSGTASDGKTLVALTLAGAYAGGVAATPATFGMVIADGERVYRVERGGDDVAMAYDRLALSPLWPSERDFNLSELSMVAQDRDCLLLLGGGYAARIYAVSKRDGALLWVSSATLYLSCCSDGSRVYGLRSSSGAVNVFVQSHAVRSLGCCRTDDLFAYGRT